MKEVSWPQVVLLSVVSVALLASVTVLAITGQDVGAILSAVSAFLVLVVGALGFGKSQQLDTKMDQVKELSNGRISQLMEDNKALHEQVTALALSHVPTKADDDNIDPSK